jgi:hypothetical protein
MSDEPAQPSLRLKPRQTPPPAAPEPVALPTESPAEPVAEVDPSPTDPFRLRLKPKAPPPEGSPDVSFATPTPFSAAPIPPEATIPVSIETPPEPPIKLTPVAPTPPPAPKAPHFSPPKPQYVPTPRGLTDPASVSTKAPASAIKADKWLAGILLFVLVIAGAIYGFRVLTKNHPKAPAHTVTPAPATAAAPEQTPTQTTPKLVEKPVSAAGKAIANARDIVAAQEKLEKEQGVTSVLEEPAAPIAPKSPAASSQATHAPVTASQQDASSAVTEPEPPPPANEAFKNYIINLRVSGVFQGENARALLNGKMYHLGDTLDPVRKIEFYKIDADAKQLIFRDDTGAIVSRHY